MKPKCISLLALVRDGKGGIIAINTVEPLIHQDPSAMEGEINRRMIEFTLHVATTGTGELVSFSHSIFQTEF